MQKNTQSRWHSPSKRSQQPHKTDTKRTDTLSMFTCTLNALPPLPLCKVIIRAGITGSGKYYQEADRCARKHNIKTHRQHGTD